MLSVPPLHCPPPEAVFSKAGELSLSLMIIEATPGVFSKEASSSSTIILTPEAPVLKD